MPKSLGGPEWNGLARVGPGFGDGPDQNVSHGQGGCAGNKSKLTNAHLSLGQDEERDGLSNAKLPHPHASYDVVLVTVLEEDSNQQTLYQSVLGEFRSKSHSSAIMLR